MSVGGIYPLADELQGLAANTVESQLCGAHPTEQELLQQGCGAL